MCECNDNLMENGNTNHFYTVVGYRYFNDVALRKNIYFICKDSHGEIDVPNNFTEDGTTYYYGSF